ncbi:MAG: hypothetical protein ACE5LS_00700 [Thermoplasmata archaeon]
MRIFKGEVERVCSRCGTEMIYFVQHAHGNYPLLDYVCPRCDLGLKEGDLPKEASDEGAGPSE